MFIKINDVDVRFLIDLKDKMEKDAKGKKYSLEDVMSSVLMEMWIKSKGDVERGQRTFTITGQDYSDF